MKQGYLSVQSTYIAIYSLIYIHCNLFDQKKIFGELTSVCRQQRLLCTCGRAVAVTTEEEASPSDVDGGGGNRHMSGVDGGRGDRRSRERWSRERESGGDLEYFGMKREITWDGLIFIGSKISEAILN
jgi:hypothetical protein